MNNKVNSQVNNEKIESFFSAIKNNSIDDIITAIEDGVDINVLTTKGNNALFVAASRKSREVFDWLLSITQKGKKIDLNNKNYNGHTLVFDCVQEGNLTYYLSELIKSNADVNIPAQNGMTPLILAAADKKTEELEMLCKAPNIDIDYAIPTSKTTAFLMACSQSSRRCVEILIENNVDQNVHDIDGKNGLLNLLAAHKDFMQKHELKYHKQLCQFLINNSTDLNYTSPTGLTAFWLVAMQRDKDLAKLLIEKNVNVDVSYEVGMEGKVSALHLWCMTKEAELVNTIIKKGGKLGELDTNKNSPEAYGFMIPELYQTLLNHGADVNAIHHEVKNKELVVPVFSMVISKGDTYSNIVEEMILKGAQIKYKNSKFDQFDPLIYAITTTSRQNVQLLLSTGKTEVNRFIKLNENFPQLNALFCTVSNFASSNFMQVLELEKNLKLKIKKQKYHQKGGQVSNAKEETEDKSDIKGMKKNLEKVKKIVDEMLIAKKDIFDMIIKAGAKVDLVNNEGQSAIFFAFYPAQAKWLQEEKANIYMKDNEGHNVLYKSVINNKKEMITYWKEELKNQPDIDTMLYQIAFEDFNNNPYQQQQIKEGIAVYLQHPQLDKYIKDHLNPEVIEKPTINIPELNYCDEDGNFPLIVACSTSALYLVDFYLFLGADINATNNLGETPLMHALATENKDLVQYLIDNSANVNIAANNGITVLEMAQELGNAPILALIKNSLNKKTTLKM